MKTLFAALAALALLASTGCASIITGTTQSVKVETLTPIGMAIKADCTLTNDKGSWKVSTPGDVTVHRSMRALDVTCEKPHYHPGSASIPSSTGGAVFGNILLGGGIGAIVDVTNGSAYHYPVLFEITLGGVIVLPGERAEDFAPAKWTWHPVVSQK